MGTLVTIAKDVKIQVEFNPARVRSYRLLGYANRMLRKEDFSNDRIDAGDIGSGHTVTAFYEIEPGDARNLPPSEALRYGIPAEETPVAPVDNREWLNVKLRYKQAEGDHSTLMTQPFTGVSREFADADADFRFGTSVAMSALVLRETEGLETIRFEDAGKLAAAALGADPHGHRAEFVSLLERLAARPR
jgi:Ca-activated chloride channel family protein